MVGRNPASYGVEVVSEYSISNWDVMPVLRINGL